MAGGIVAGVGEGEGVYALSALFAYGYLHWIALIRDHVSGDWLCYDDATVSKVGDGSFADTRAFLESTDFLPTEIIYTASPPPPSASLKGTSPNGWPAPEAKLEWGAAPVRLYPAPPVLSPVFLNRSCSEVRSLGMAAICHDAIRALWLCPVRYTCTICADVCNQHVCICVTSLLTHYFFEDEFNFRASEQCVMKRYAAVTNSCMRCG